MSSICPAEGMGADNIVASRYRLLSAADFRSVLKNSAVCSQSGSAARAT
jgi:hypothetical protein